ncbi:efflux RND transporter permease subunit [bacterium]|nr:efflux RND transporter permease subunit [bacterium]
MLEKIYSSPLRVYVATAIIGLLGIALSFKLPVSLFPDASKAAITVGVDPGSMTPEMFESTYGNTLESQLRAINTKSLKVEKVEATYDTRHVSFDVSFEWGSDGDEAKKEVQTIANAFASTLPADMRDTLWVWRSQSNTGFLALSFFSEKRTAVETYDLIEPVLQPKFSQVPDAERVVLYNPSSEQITVTPKLLTLLSLGIQAEAIKTAILDSKKSYGGGTVKFGESSISVVVPRAVNGFEDFKQLPVKSASGKSFPLAQLAKVEKGPNPELGRSFKTSGFSSLIIFASPKPGGNIKRMSEDILAIVKESQPSFPEDIQYKILVDPSEFIRDSIKNVAFEVGLAAFLAVFVLFLFIGRLQNVITAAIEIPLSMLLAFILMYFFGMNLNLISLGGLALAAGMNVDASVVVMENIFRHVAENPSAKSFKQRLALVTLAVREVQVPLISSTLSSLLVFAPLAATSALTYAVLGDLAKAIIFSHGFSAFVAIILVPTIRLQMLSRNSDVKERVLIQKPLDFFETRYLAFLKRILVTKALRRVWYFGIVALFAVGVGVLLPSLPKQLLGEIDSDWLTMRIHSQKSKYFKEMESISDEVENDILKKYPDQIAYTFMQVDNESSSRLMLRLKKKSQMNTLLESLEKDFEDTPFVSYRVHPWNPSELSLPNPPHFLVEVNGATQSDRIALVREMVFELREKRLYDRAWGQPSEHIADALQLKPRQELFDSISMNSSSVSVASLSGLSHMISSPQYVTSIDLDKKDYMTYIQFEKDLVKHPDDFGAFPLVVGEKVIPLRALFDVSIVKDDPSIWTFNGRLKTELRAKLDKKDEPIKRERRVEAIAHLNDWLNSKKLGRETGSEDTIPYSKLSIEFPEPEVELKDAISQLTTATLLSLLMIACILFFQFGSLSELLVVMMAIPFGIIGASFSLFVFGSYLSLNSVLGIILLNGISVANSILLVDFMNRLSREGVSAEEAALTASRKRLRPILMTSLTTVLGMMPIAFGLGQGAKVLQPLGIAVSGGLGLSMLLTLFTVPVLHASIISRRLKRAKI